MTHSPAQLRIAVLNLWGRFGNWPERLTQLANEWDAIDADVLLCSEVCVGARGDQVQETATALDFAHHATALAAEHEDYQEGVSIFSHFPLAHTMAQPLPESLPARVALSASIPLGTGLLRVATAHATYAPEPIRRAQIEAVAQLVPRGPSVVGADLNTTPEEMEADHLQMHGLVDAFADSDVVTWPNSPEALRAAWRARLGRDPMFPLEPRRRLDYLLTRDVHVLARGHSTLGDEERGYVSDHALLYIDVCQV